VSTIFYTLRATAASSPLPLVPPTIDEALGPETVDKATADPVGAPVVQEEPVRSVFFEEGSSIPDEELDQPFTVQYVVRVGWEATPANAFTLDASQLDSSKVLTSQFTSFLNLIQFDISEFGGLDGFADDFSALFSDVSEDVKQISIRRGRDGNLTDFQAGEATVTLHDPDSRYSPLNPDSDLHPYVTPGRPIIIEALLNGERYGMFRGFVRSIEHDPEKTARETRLTCQDLFLYLERAKPEIVYQAPPITTGEAIAVVLDAIGWQDDRLRQLGFGDFLGGGFGPFTGSTSALTIIRDLIQTERGEFFHGRDGVVRYFFRHARYLRNADFLLDEAVAGALPAADLTNIKNRATVTKTGSGSQSFEDANSVANFGPSDFTPIDSAYINTPADALALAQYIVSQAKDASPPVRAVDFVASQSYGFMFIAFMRELGDRVFLKDAAVGLAQREFFIEGIEHQITNGGKLHRTAFTLSKVPPAAPLIFDTTRLVVNEFSSPTTDTAPYTTADTAADIFAY
jgi:hypothetical protein